MGLFINNVTECPHCGKTIELSDSHCCPYCGREVELSTQASFGEIIELIKDSFWAVATFLVGIVLTIVMIGTLDINNLSWNAVGLLALGIAFTVGGYFWVRSQIKEIKRRRNR